MFFGPGLVTTAYITLLYNGEFYGVACVDVSFNYLFGDIEDLVTEQSYVFVMDSQSRLLTHPLLPQTKNDDPNFVHMSVLEPGEFSEEIRLSMLKLVTL